MNFKNKLKKKRIRHYSGYWGRAVTKQIFTNPCSHKMGKEGGQVVQKQQIIR